MRSPNAVLLLAYAISLRDAVFIAGLALGPLIHGRNLVVTYKPGVDAGARLETGKLRP